MELPINFNFGERGNARLFGVKTSNNILSWPTMSHHIDGFIQNSPKLSICNSGVYFLFDLSSADSNFAGTPYIIGREVTGLEDIDSGSGFKITDLKARECIFREIHFEEAQNLTFSTILEIERSSRELLERENSLKDDWRFGIFIDAPSCKLDKDVIKVTLEFHIKD